MDNPLKKMLQRRKEHEELKARFHAIKDDLTEEDAEEIVKKNGRMRAMNPE